jgi:hypothetical protein
MVVAMVVIVLGCIATLWRRTQRIADQLKAR